MSWVYSIAVALLIALASGGGGLWLGERVVRWYRISSFEGKAGYAVVLMAMAALAAGFLVGLITARVAVAMGVRTASFGGQLLASTAVALAVFGAVTGLARVFADVPPRLDGKTLDLLVEVRLPAEQTERPAWTHDEAGLSLGSVSMRRRRQRASRVGELDSVRAREEDGRWVIPGRVPVFTARGSRVISVTLGELHESFLVPLPLRPGRPHLQWSEWLPRPRADGGRAVNTLTYRFRVEPGAD